MILTDSYHLHLSLAIRWPISCKAIAIRRALCSGEVILTQHSVRSMGRERWVYFQYLCRERWGSLGDCMYLTLREAKRHSLCHTLAFVIALVIAFIINSVISSLSHRSRSMDHDASNRLSLCFDAALVEFNISLCFPKPSLGGAKLDASRGLVWEFTVFCILEKSWNPRYSPSAGKGAQVMHGEGGKKSKYFLVTALL